MHHLTALRRWPIGLALCALLGTGLAPAHAAEVRWRTSKYQYQTKGQDLRDFLRAFAANQGLSMVVDAAIDNKSVVGNFDVSPQSMLEWLANTYGLIWYYDGNVMYIYPSSEAKSQVLRLNNTSPERLRQSLDRLGISDRRYPVKFDKTANTALVSGPKRFVELVQQAVAGAEQGEDGRNSNTDIQVFPLKYAWAADYTFNQGGREFKLPGVATVLSSLYNSGSSGSAVPVRGTRRGGSSTIDKLRGLGLADSQTSGVEVAKRELADEIEADKAGSAQLGLPQFQPDGRLNAVVVRDRPDRMAFYENVIRRLDVKPGIVEIEVRIIDVSTDAVESLGVDWRAQGSRADLQVGRGALPSLDFNNALNGQSPPGTGNNAGGAGVLPGGGVLSLRLGDAGRFLLARVTALAEQGKATMLSSPRVITLDNVEAVLENFETFFVKVAGNLDVDLFNISAGTSLRVTPLIVEEGNDKHIKLAIKIEDGNITNKRVETLPVVQRTAIGTQAYIADGDALLIGGYVREVDNSTEVGVPGVSRIPIFGRLFRYDEKKKQRVERMFLLTPRILPMPGARAALTPMPAAPASTPAAPVEPAAPVASPKAPS
jgi:type III secretion protein C